MNCNRCEELMSDYLEGALNVAERDTVGLHLKSCAACTDLVAGMANVLEWGKAFPLHRPPVSLHARIIASTPIVSCSRCEELMSDYLEATLHEPDRIAVSLHLDSCAACGELVAAMNKVIEWGKTFPVHEPPAWLPTRIIANTPQIARESWLDTLRAGWKWIADPRVAMGLFTATLVLGWLGSLAGFSPDWTTVVRNPAGIYYEAQGAMNRAYDEAIRRYYRSPFVTGVRSRIEQLREIS